MILLKVCFLRLKAAEDALNMLYMIVASIVRNTLHTILIRKSHMIFLGKIQQRVCHTLDACR